MRTGQAIGSTDRIGGNAKDRPVSFGDIFATLYRNLGLEPETTTIMDLTGRPHLLVEGGTAGADLTRDEGHNIHGRAEARLCRSRRASSIGYNCSGQDDPDSWKIYVSCNLITPTASVPPTPWADTDWWECPSSRYERMVAAEKSHRTIESNSSKACW